MVDTVSLKTPKASCAGGDSLGGREPGEGELDDVVAQLAEEGELATNPVIRLRHELLEAPDGEAARREAPVTAAQ